MIAAIILAAGASSRMGRPKALLRLCGATFLQQIADTLRSAPISDIVAVIGAGAEEIRTAIPDFSEFVINEHWQDGQLSSVVAGLNAVDVPRIDGVMICPVDRPLFSGKLVAGMLEAYRTSGKSIILPTYEGRNGHPVIFGRSLFGELRSGAAGARAVIHAHPDEVFRLPTAERGVVVNIDTMQDYLREVLPCAQ